MKKDAKTAICAGAAIPGKRSESMPSAIPTKTYFQLEKEREGGFCGGIFSLEPWLEISPETANKPLKTQKRGSRIPVCIVRLPRKPHRRNTREAFAIFPMLRSLMRRNALAAKRKSSMCGDIAE